MPVPPDLYPSFADPQLWRDGGAASLLNGPEWRALRESILQLDAYLCRFCGFHADQCLMVHHLDGDPGNNAPKNLCTICPLCHLIIHCGLGCCVAGVVDLYGYSGYSQVEVIRQTLAYRANGLTDPEIISRLGLRQQAPFRTDRNYLRQLTGFITSRRPAENGTAYRLSMMLEIERSRQRAAEGKRDEYLSERIKRYSVVRERLRNTSVTRTTVSFRATGVLRSTFCHVAGVGPFKERKIWEAGIATWDEFSARNPKLRFLGPLARRIEDVLNETDRCSSQGNWEPLQKLHSEGQMWRLYPCLLDNALYLDIETTGLRAGWDEITVIATYNGQEFRFFTRGLDLEEFPKYLEGFGFIITFNGSTFDLPFLRASFENLKLGQPAWDIKWSLKRLGHGGPLKEIESRMGLRRPPALAKVEGYDAVQLWRAHEQGDPAALSILQRYAAEDVASLPVLATIAFNGHAKQIPFPVVSIQVPQRPVPPVSFDPAALERILEYKLHRGIVIEAQVLQLYGSREHRESRLPSEERSGFWIMEPSLRCKKKPSNSGKWLIFAPPERIDTLWDVIVANIRHGTLGELCIEAKVSTARPNPNSLDPRKHVICVYAPDSDNEAEVMRIRHLLREIGIMEKIPYKTDAATAAGLYAVEGDLGIARFWA